MSTPLWAQLRSLSESLGLPLSRVTGAALQQHLAAQVTPAMQKLRAECFGKPPRFTLDASPKPRGLGPRAARHSATRTRRAERREAPPRVSLPPIDLHEINVYGSDPYKDLETSHACAQPSNGPN